jgi:hypothetical protein
MFKVLDGDARIRTLSTKPPTCEQWKAISSFRNVYIILSMETRSLSKDILTI